MLNYPIRKKLFNHYSASVTKSVISETAADKKAF